MGDLFPRPFGRYLLLRSLGAGGMAEIFLGLAQGPAGFRKVFAIKCLHPHLAREANFVKLFLDEARLAARLSHANIVQTFELGVHEETYFIAMEYVHGVNLAQLLARGRLPLPIAMTIGIEVTSALGFAHAAKDEQGMPLSIIHRDVTPRNILISFSGEVKLADFGIARAADQLHVTVTGECRGTLRYMSPEQLNADPVDHRADIYSLGVSLFEAFSGQRLFQDVSSSKLHDPQVRQSIPALSVVRPDLPGELDRILERALAPEPGRRFQSCVELLEVLKATGAKLGLTDAGRDAMSALLRERFPSESAKPIFSDGEIRSAAPEAGTSPTVVLDGSDDKTPSSVSMPPPSSVDGALSPAHSAARTTGKMPASAREDYPSTHGRRAGRWWPMGLASVLVVGAIVAVVVASRSTGRQPIRAAAPPSAPLPAKVALPAPSSAPPPARPALKQEQITIEITSTPRGALVVVDGVDVGRTPLTLTRRRDPLRELKLLLLLENYVPARRSIALTTDRQIALPLVRRRARPTKSAAPALQRPPAPTKTQPSIPLKPDDLK